MCRWKKDKAGSDRVGLALNSPLEKSGVMQFQVCLTHRPVQRTFLTLSFLSLNIQIEETEINNCKFPPSLSLFCSEFLHFRW